MDVDGLVASTSSYILPRFSQVVTVSDLGIDGSEALIPIDLPGLCHGCTHPIHQHTAVSAPSCNILNSLHSEPEETTSDDGMEKASDGLLSQISYAIPVNVITSVDLDPTSIVSESVDILAIVSDFSLADNMSSIESGNSVLVDNISTDVSNDSILVEENSIRVCVDVISFVESTDTLTSAAPTLKTEFRMSAFRLKFLSPIIVSLLIESCKRHGYMNEFPYPGEKLEEESIRLRSQYVAQRAAKVHEHITTGNNPYGLIGNKYMPTGMHTN
jgi:hypothetical protein